MKKFRLFMPLLALFGWPLFLGLDCNPKKPAAAYCPELLEELFKINNVGFLSIDITKTQDNFVDSLVTPITEVQKVFENLTKKIVEINTGDKDRVIACHKSGVRIQFSESAFTSLLKTVENSILTGKKFKTIKKPDGVTAQQLNKSLAITMMVLIMTSVDMTPVFFNDVGYTTIEKREFIEKMSFNYDEYLKDRNKQDLIVKNLREKQAQIRKFFEDKQFGALSTSLQIPREH